MIPLAVPNLTGNERKYLNECIDSSFVSTVGAFVPKFESAIAKASSVSHCIATASGTSAIHLALVVAGVKPNDLVLMPSYTFIATANAVSHAGAIPWLVDCTEESWTMDIEITRQLLEQQTVRSKDGVRHRTLGNRVGAILPVATLGLSPELSSFRKLADDFNLPLVLDAAAAIGGLYRGQSLALLPDLTTYSFNGNKIITSGGGGAIVSQKPDFVRHAHHLCSTARIGSEYEHDEVGFNYRITNVEAALGCAQIERLSEFIDIKRNIAALYKEKFAVLPNCTSFPEVNWAQSTHWLTGIVLGSGNIDTIRNLCAELQSRGIGARSFWKPMHLQQPYLNCPRSQMNVCEDLWDRVLTLPCSTSLTRSEQEFIIANCRELLAGNGEGNRT